MLLAFHRHYYCDDNVNARACNFILPALNPRYKHFANGGGVWLLNFFCLLN